MNRFLTCATIQSISWLVLMLGCKGHLISGTLSPYLLGLGFGANFLSFSRSGSATVLSILTVFAGGFMANIYLASIGQSVVQPDGAIFYSVASALLLLIIIPWTVAYVDAIHARVDREYAHDVEMNNTACFIVLGIVLFSSMSALNQLWILASVFCGLLLILLFVVWIRPELVHLQYRQHG